MLVPSKNSVYELVSHKDTQKKTYAYHAHDFREVLSVVSSWEGGLSYKEVKRRQHECGKNVFTQENRTNIFKSIFLQLKSPLAFVLVIALLLTIGLEEFVDAVVIALALSVAVFVGVLQEGKSSRAFEKLSNSQVHTATVIRDQKKQEVLSADLVFGDIVILQSGMQVPADLRLIQSKQLSINESALTGEWLAVNKDTRPVAVGAPFAEQTSMAWMGTFVAQGYATGVVVATGDNTAVGKLASDVREVEEVNTPLQEEMIRISRVMLYLIGGLVSLIFLVGLMQGNALQEMLLMTVAIAVAAVPEGLPAAVTIILAVGMEALLKRGGLVRNLLAAETLGSTTYVLTDKTGTLTQAKMTVEGVIADNGFVRLRGQDKSNQSLRTILEIALAGADAYTDLNTREHVIHGDPVESAIVKAANTMDISEFEDSLRSQRIDYLSFTSENRFAAGLSVEDDSYKLCCNGAPSILLANATSLLTEEGERTITESDKKEIIQKITNQTVSGKRLVAVGYKKVSYDDIPEADPHLLDNLVFAGVIVFDDPVREGISDAIEGVQSAGAQVVLITGDNPQTALSVASAVGIAEDDDVVFTGLELEELTDEELYIALNDIRVFARVLPSQKMRIVSVLQQKGEIVAMTGDGINDAPALRKANIGVAIGSGTEVAKEASDLVLMKDSFATIYAAIEEGRRIIGNLKKIVGYLLATSFSEVFLIGLALILSAPVPILPVQILWANVIEEGFMSVAFAFEKGDKNAMERKPKDIHEEGIFSPKMMYFTGVIIVIHGLLLSSLYLYLRHLQLPIDELRSVIFLAVAIDSLFISFAFRSLTTPFWCTPLRNNLFFVGSFLLSSALLLAVLSVPFLQEILSYTPLPWNEILMVIGFSISILITVEIAKWIFFAKDD